jgi:predicted permease
VLPTLGVVADGEVFVSMRLAANAPDNRGREDYNILARLRAGVTPAEAQAEMDALTARLREAHPDLYPPNGGLTFSVVPLKDQVVGEARTAVWVLSAAVAFVLLIACANVANLLLSRSLERRREVAVRAALGAGRARLVRQLLTESVMLAVAGGALGVLVAWWSLAGIRVLGPASVPRLSEITLDAAALGFTLAVSIGAGILFGVVPALRLGRIERHGALREAARGVSDAGSAWRRGRGGRRLLVVVELALAVVVLVGAGLLVRSFTQLQNVPPGFDPSGVLTMEITLTGQRYPDSAAVTESYRQLWDRLSALPDVSAAGGISALPLSNMMAWGPITVEGRQPPPGERFLNADLRFVAADYFEAMRIPVVQGRRFAAADIAANPRVAVIDEFMAGLLWPGVEAVGKRFRLGGPDSTSPWVTVVGVAGRIKQDALDTDSRIAVYLPHTQFPSRAINIVVRTEADPARLAGPVTTEIRRLDPDLPIYNVRTMEDRVSESLARRRFAVVLLALFAGLALALAAIGVYGVIAYLVSQGTREIGIRMALGATPRRILLLVLRHGAVTVAAGLLLGLAGAAGAVQFMRRLLFGVEPLDLATFGAVAFALGLIALAATAIPARRALRIEPSVSLRAD